ncbi:MAG: MMPL family transporter [Acidobacteria bacterium]|nr:MMPL family transporter [Acidobacteriota bacterium]
MNRLTALSLDHPWWTIGLTIVATLAFAAQFRKITIDTDPKHMLPVTSPVRQHNDQVERDFALHADTIVLGIVNERGVVNHQTLTRIERLTREIQKIPGVIVRDVVSLSTIDNVAVRGGQLLVGPMFDAVPGSDADVARARTSVLENPLFVNRIISRDATTTAVYVPIEPTANGKAIADEIRALLPSEPGHDRFYLAGDPVARDTFGTEMFRQMAVFSPMAGAVLCAVLWLIFRSTLLVVANMAVAMTSIIWSMGLLMGLGYPVHIMSSMSPVFLMAIATDSVHIFNEFGFRFREVPDKRRALLETMQAVAGPVFYSDATTAAGFAALATATIVPVKIFGLVVAFGTLVILLMSFTLVPAILSLLREDRIAAITRRTAGDGHRPGRWLPRLGWFCSRRARAIAAVGAASLIVAGVGLSRIHVNNNMVHWFKSGSEVRTADRILNANLGGTSTAYLTVQGRAEDVIKAPEMLRGIEGVQRELEKDPRVGKTFSVVDYVRRVSRVLHADDAAFDRIPDSAEEVGQYLFLFGSSAKPSDLDNVVDYPFQNANIFVQLKSWDADVMRDIIQRTATYVGSRPLPGAATIRPAGIAYFNLVWSDEVLWGMLESFSAGIALVLLLLIAQTRSLRWGVLACLPLLFTIALIYGVVGLVGKDFDMPVAVLSTLSLGLAIDFAIHFVARFRERYRQDPRLDDALVWTVARPGRGIFLNAILFASGFAVMALADLTPYVTVGVLMAAIMLLSALMSVVYLPVLIHLFHPVLLKEGA